MLLVIFGAGASFDSAPTYPPGANVLGGDRLNNFHRPPLANELFENRPVFAEAITRLPECQPIGADAPEITARFRDPGGNVIGLYQQPA